MVGLEPHAQHRAPPGLVSDTHKNQAAVVCALDLSPTQLRIAEQIAVAPERRGKSMPEVVRIKDGQLQAETWIQG